MDRKRFLATRGDACIRIETEPDGKIRFRPSRVSRMAWWVVSAWLALAPNVAFSRPPPPQLSIRPTFVAPAPYGDLNLLMVDEAGLEISGVSVLLATTDKRWSLEGISDGLGHYRITDLPDGTYDIAITRAGFASVTVDRVRVVTGSTTSLVVEMPLVSAVDRVTVGRPRPRLRPLRWLQRLFRPSR